MSTTGSDGSGRVDQVIDVEKKQRNLAVERTRIWVGRTGRDTRNSHDSEWDDRATEHVAETIAFALTDDPRDVEWVETPADGSRQVTRRILTIDIDTETLGENFVRLTGAQG